MKARNTNRTAFFKRAKNFSLIVFALICLLIPSQSSSGQDDRMSRPSRPERRDLWLISLICARYAGQASRAEIVQTPRQFPDLERLAIKMGGTFTANPAIYARVVTNVTRIRSSYPQLNYPYFGENDGKSIYLNVDAATFERMKAGGYREWNCLNDLYRLVKADYRDYVAERYVFLEFKGIYNADLLAQEYSRLPGVKNVGTNRWVGGAPDICGTIDGAEYHYVFDLASGDCPAGCINHRYFYFVNSPSEAPRFVGEWLPQTGSPPDWMRRYGRCYRYPGSN